MEKFVDATTSFSGLGALRVRVRREARGDKSVSLPCSSDVPRRTVPLGLLITHGLMGMVTSPGFCPKIFLFRFSMEESLVLAKKKC